MPRTNGGTFNAAMLSYIQGTNSYRLANLISVAFSGGTQYFTDAGKNISYGGNTYENDGLKETDNLVDTLDLRLRQFNFTLTTVDNTNITPALNTTFEGVEVIVYKALLDNDYDIINSGGSDIIWIQFQGELESFEIKETVPNSVITWTATDKLVIYDRLRSRKTNNEEQQIYFSGDSGFEFVGQYSEVEWGRKS